MSTARDGGFLAPAEWAAHSRCWMAWPARESLWGEGLEAAQDDVAALATAIAAFEPVTVITSPVHLAEASLRFGAGVSCVPMEIDDCWLRDVGPSFVIDGKGTLAGVDGGFNGWGGREGDHGRDAGLAAAWLGDHDIARHGAGFVLEGGAICHDGEGTALVSEVNLLDPNRNPESDPARLQQALSDCLGVEKVIWLAGKLDGDRTGGRVENLACFVRPGVVLAQVTDEQDDANHAVLAENLERLRAATDAKGRELEVVEIEQPRPQVDDQGRRKALSYVSLYVAKGAVILPEFEKAGDDKAFEVISQSFPEHEAVCVPILGLAAQGAGIRAVTLGQPEV